MATLSGNKIKNTYQSLVKFSDNGNITTSAKQLTDGFGNNSPMFVSTTQVGIGVTPESGLNLHVFGDAKIGSNLTVIGNLVVEGSTTTVGTDTLTVKDPLIVLANNNTSTDAVDIGFYGKYHPSGTTLYSGLFREALTGKYRLFKGLEVEPTTTVNTSGTGYAVATLIANLEGNVTGNLIGSVTGGTFSGTLLSNVVATTQSANDNSTKVATTAYVDNQVGLYDTLSEVLVNGNTTGGTDIAVTANDNITFVDDSKAIFGTDGDLEIYHFSTTDQAFISINGELDIRANTLSLKSYVGETMLRASSNGTVRLYYDGVEKLQTTSTGVSITGVISGLTDPSAAQDAATKNYVDTQIGANNELSEVLANGNTSGANDIIMADNQKIYYGTGSDVEMYFDGATQFGIINDTGGGSIFLRSSSFAFTNGTNQFYSMSSTTHQLKSSGTTRLTVNASGADVNGVMSSVSASILTDLTVDTDTLFVDASEDSVGIGLTNPADYSADELVISVPDDSGMTLVSGTTDTAYITFADGTTAAAQSNFISHDHNTNTLTIFSQAKVSIGILEAEVAYFTDTNFYVDKSTTIDDTLTVNGNSTFAGDVTINTGELYITADSGINTTAKFESGSGSTISYLQLLPNGASNANSGYIGYDTSNNLKLFTQNTLALTLDTSQNATFAGNVTAPTIDIASTSVYQAKIKSTGAQYLLIGSTDAGSAGIVLDGDSNGDGAGGDYSYLLHEASGILKLQQDSPSGTNELHFGTAGIESRMIIDSSGAISIGTRKAATPSVMGYSSSYKTLILGSTGTDYTTDSVTLAFGVNVSANASGSFNGNGREYIWRNEGSFITPNAANNGYNSILNWTSSGYTYFASRVGIGTVSPDLTGFGYNTLTVVGGTTAGYAGVLELGSPTTNANGQNLGIIAFMDGSTRNAQIDVTRASSTSTSNMHFYTNGGSGIVERMRITSGGNVGINESNPTYGKLQIKTGSAIGYTPTSFMSGTNLRLTTGGTATQNVTTGVSMGIGGAAEAYIGAVQNVSNYADIVFQTYHAGYGERMRIESNGSSNFYGNITISKSTPFITLSNTAEDECGIVMLDSADAGQSAKITYDAGSSNALKFYNNASVERMRVIDTGYIKARGRYTTSYEFPTHTFHSFEANESNEPTMVLFNDTTSTAYGLNVINGTDHNNTSSRFFLGQGGSTERIKIFSNGNIANTNNSYTALSDIKLKENIEDATPKLDELMQVRIRNYNLIGEELKQIGVVAQELEEVFPALVYETPDTERQDINKTDEEGNIIYQIEKVLTSEAVEGQEAIEWEDKPTINNTKFEIQTWLDDNNIEWQSADTKQELLDRISEYKQEAIEAQDAVYETRETDIPETINKEVDLGTTTKAVKYSIFVPIMIKAMQEQQQIINDLKSRIETLENN